MHAQSVSKSTFLCQRFAHGWNLATLTFSRSKLSTCTIGVSLTTGTGQIDQLWKLMKPSDYNFMMHAKTSQPQTVQSYSSTCTLLELYKRSTESKELGFSLDAGSNKFVSAALPWVTKSQGPCVWTQPCGITVQLLYTPSVSSSQSTTCGFLQCGKQDAEGFGWGMERIWVKESGKTGENFYLDYHFPSS